MSDATTPVHRALLAVYDKTGVVAFAGELVARGVALVSSGGTAATLREAGLPVTPVEEVTGSPEMLGGRVKTLHPAIHGGILADRRKQDHVDQLVEQGIEPFDLVVVNLYPFRETVAGGASFEETIEQIDIGGPAMVRAAAKNHANVGVVVDPGRYDAIVAELDAEGGLTAGTRRALAAAAYAHTAAYDAAVAGWFAQQGAAAEAASGDEPELLPAFVGLAYEKVGELRYGENPHQRGALYRESGSSGVFGGASVLQGKDMSFNNWLDAYAAYELVAAMPEGSAVIVKHNNPCGAAARGTLADSYRAAFECDTVSAFGGIVAFHGEVDVDAAQAMADVFTEVVIAPSYTAGASASFGAAPEPADRRRADARWERSRRAADARRGPRAGPGPRDRDARRLEGRLEPRAVRAGVGRPGARVDDRLAREVEHDRARAERRDRGRGRRTDVARGLVVDRDAQGGGAGTGCRGRERRVLPVPRRARGGRGRWLHRRDPPRRFEGRRGGPRVGRGPRDGRRPHRASPLPALTDSLVAAPTPGVGFAA